MPLEPLKKVLRDARFKAGLSRPQLSQMSGISEDTILKIEKGRHVPQGQTVCLLALPLGLDPDVLLALRDKEAALNKEVAS